MKTAASISGVLEKRQKVRKGFIKRNYELSDGRLLEYKNEKLSRTCAFVSVEVVDAEDRHGFKVDFDNGESSTLFAPSVENRDEWVTAFSQVLESKTPRSADKKDVKNTDTEHSRNLKLTFQEHSIGVTFGLDDEYIYVSDVAPHGIGARAGVLIGDIVTLINSTQVDVNSPDEFAQALQNCSTPFEMSFSRTNFFSFTFVEGPLGIKVQNREGYLTVTSVDPEKQAAKVGVCVGDIVIGFNDGALGLAESANAFSELVKGLPRPYKLSMKRSWEPPSKPKQIMTPRGEPAAVATTPPTPTLIAAPYPAATEPASPPQQPTEPAVVPPAPEASAEAPSQDQTSAPPTNEATTINAQPEPAIEPKRDPEPEPTQVEPSHSQAESSAAPEAPTADSAEPTPTAETPATVADTVADADADAEPASTTETSTTDPSARPDSAEPSTQQTPANDELPMPPTKPLQITMLEPIIEQGDKPHVVFSFEVCTTWTNEKFTTCHRYTEFDNLRNELVKVYPSVAALPFPGKTLFRSTSMAASTIQNRNETLRDWLTAVGELVPLSDSPHLASFIFASTAPQDKEKENDNKE
eukprot:c12103_g2_i2.p1 GENE.c12103_g2_i2~~c12103_g2_i2.p1  ORF type:complete len:613 (-),score=146.77 c12103_g2_i2:462-2207(-)